MDPFEKVRALQHLNSRFNRIKLGSTFIVIRAHKKLDKQTNYKLLIDQSLIIIVDVLLMQSNLSLDNVKKSMDRKAYINRLITTQTDVTESKLYLKYIYIVSVDPNFNLLGKG